MEGWKEALFVVHLSGVIEINRKFEKRSPNYRPTIYMSIVLNLTTFNIVFSFQPVNFACDRLGKFEVLKSTS